MSTFKPFSLLVTGAPGRLADAVLSRLGEALPALTRVRCLVDSSHAEEAAAAWRCGQASVTEVIRGTMLEEEALENFCANAAGGVLLHTAEIVHPAQPEEWNAINRDAAVKLAEIARKAGLRRFVFISSLAAQGASPAGGALTEDMACHPFSEYGRSKHEAEEAILRLHTPGEFEAVIIRTGEIYGPPISAEHLELFHQVALGRVRLARGGEVMRSLSYIDDLADGVVSALHHPKAAGTVLNLCDAQSYTEREIVEAIAAAMGTTVHVLAKSSMLVPLAGLMDRLYLRFGRYARNMQELAHSHYSSAATCAKAQHILGHKPHVALHEGMRREVEWARGHGLLD